MITGHIVDKNGKTAPVENEPQIFGNLRYIAGSTAPTKEQIDSAFAPVVTLESKINAGLAYLASKGLTAPILTVLSNIRSAAGGTFPAGTLRAALADYIDGVQAAALAGLPLSGEPPESWKSILGA